MSARNEDTTIPWFWKEEEKRISALAPVCDNPETGVQKAEKFPRPFQINLTVKSARKRGSSVFLAIAALRGAWKWWHMASIDIQETPGPKRDRLGLSCLIFHLAVGAFVLMGWVISSYETLMFYLVLLPAMATQWAINKGSCIINNLESWLRSGRWRDPENPEEGGFLLMLCEWMFAIRPSSVLLDRFSYAVVVFLWLLALGHISWLAIV